MNDADAGHIAPTLQNAWDGISHARERFEQAWQSGTVPGISDFLAIGASGGIDADVAQRTLIVELIKVDLEQRWRRAGNAAAATAEFKTVESETLAAAPGS